MKEYDYPMNIMVIINIKFPFPILTFLEQSGNLLPMNR